MSDLLIRPAVPADLGQVHDIWYRAEVEEFPGAPPLGDLPAIFRHELDTGEMFVAEASGRVLGYTALIRRGAVAYLAELYVRTEAQSAGIGQALLARVLRDPAGSNGFSHRIVCTLSSDDHRALALYARAGLIPRWPHFLLYGTPSRELPPVNLKVVPAAPGDPELLRFDGQVSGRPRPEDHTYWLEHAAATPFWFIREGEAIGYGYVQARNHEVALWYPEALYLGPIGARSAAEALDCTLAAVAWAARQAPALVVPVPGAHPCLSPLLAAGFRISYVETFVASTSDVPFDPACYLPSSSTLF
jgi:ribosomal protein S18 acetylase RimI-like enzyme